MMNLKDKNAQDSFLVSKSETKIKDSLQLLSENVVIWGISNQDMNPQFGVGLLSTLGLHGGFV